MSLFANSEPELIDLTLDSSDDKVNLVDEVTISHHSSPHFLHLYTTATTSVANDDDEFDIHSTTELVSIETPSTSYWENSHYPPCKTQVISEMQAKIDKLTRENSKLTSKQNEYSELVQQQCSLLIEKSLEIGRLKTEAQLKDDSMKKYEIAIKYLYDERQKLKEKLETEQLEFQERNATLHNEMCRLQSEQKRLEQVNQKFVDYSNSVIELNRMLLATTQNGYEEENKEQKASLFSLST